MIPGPFVIDHQSPVSRWNFCLLFDLLCLVSVGPLVVDHVFLLLVTMDISICVSVVLHGPFVIDHACEGERVDFKGVANRTSGCYRGSNSRSPVIVTWGPVTFPFPSLTWLHGVILSEHRRHRNQSVRLRVYADATTIRSFFRLRIGAVVVVHSQ